MWLGFSFVQGQDSIVGRNEVSCRSAPIARHSPMATRPAAKAGDWRRPPVSAVAGVTWWLLVVRHSGRYGHFLNERSGRLALRSAVVVMALLAAAKLGDELARLVWRSDVTAAIDLKWRYAEVQGWFNGVAVYRTMLAPTYPPASYVLLWPFLGWMSWGAARWFWAATTLVALAVLTWLVVRETGATGAWHRTLAALLLLAMNQTGVVVGNGQLTFHVLAPLVAGLLLLHRGSGTWTEDLAASAGVIFAMLKVTLAAPFLWLVVFAPRPAANRRIWPWRLRPLLLVAACYLTLTAFAASFQGAGLPTQLREWIGVTRTVSDRVGDYADVSA